MSQYLEGAAVRTAALGNRAKKTATVVASGATDDLFSVDGGAVWLLGLVGIVTTALGANTDLDIDFDPDDGGSNVALSSTLVADSDVTGTIYAMNSTNGGAVVAGTDVAYNGLLADPVLLTAGDILLTVTGGGGGTGVIDWYAIWLPLEDGATLTAAA